MKNTETCILEDRGIIYIEGPDTNEFLQNIITNDLNKVSDKQSIFSSLLTPQGKYLFDFIVVKHKKGYLLDCEKTEIDNLIKTLNLYKLRSKLEILNLSNEFIVAAVSFDKYLSLETNQEPGYTIKYREDTVLLDPKNIYYEKSYKLGIAQKKNSKLKDKIFGVECNFEELNAIDFKKGCFVGQENTSRIRLRNKLRRRLLPLKANEGKILEDDLIKFNNKEVGRVLIHDPFPFAIIKVTDPNINEFLNKELLCGSAKVEVIKPEWLKL